MPHAPTPATGRNRARWRSVRLLLAVTGCLAVMLMVVFGVSWTR